MPAPRVHLTSHSQRLAVRHRTTTTQCVHAASTTASVIALTSPLTTRSQPVTSHSVPAMITTLQQCARPSPLADRNRPAADRSPSRVNPSSSAIATDARVGPRAIRVLHHRPSQGRNTMRSLQHAILAPLLRAQRFLTEHQAQLMSAVGPHGRAPALGRRRRELHHTRRRSRVCVLCRSSSCSRCRHAGQNAGSSRLPGRWRMPPWSTRVPSSSAVCPLTIPRRPVSASTQSSTASPVPIVAPASTATPTPPHQGGSRMLTETTLPRSASVDPTIRGDGLRSY